MKARKDYKKMVEQKDRAQRLTNRLKVEAANDGALAFVNDENNPYSKNHPLYQFWLDGWNEEKYLQESE